MKHHFQGCFLFPVLSLSLFHSFLTKLGNKAKKIYLNIFGQYSIYCFALFDYKEEFIYLFIYFAPIHINKQ